MAWAVGHAGKLRSEATCLHAQNSEAACGFDLPGCQTIHGGLCMHDFLARVKTYPAAMNCVRVDEWSSSSTTNIPTTPKDAANFVGRANLAVLSGRLTSSIGRKIWSTRAGLHGPHYAEPVALSN